MFREHLRELLTDYNKKISNYDEVTQENITELANGARVVITGQQPQLCGGSLLIIYKIVGLIYHAKKLQEQYAERIVPVFWIAGEDHDITEMDHLYVNTDIDVKKIAVKWSKKPLLSASDVYISEKQVQQLICDISKVLPDSFKKKQLIELIRRFYDGNSTLSLSFAKIVTYFFKGWGVVFYDAHDFKARNLQISFFEKIIDNAYQVSNILQASCSLTTQVQIKSKHIGLYYSYASRRRAIYYDQLGDFFYLENVDKKFSIVEIKEIIRMQPQQISCNVLIRIICQQFMFEPILYIGGVNELKYWQQTDKLFAWFNFNKPHLLERKSFLLLGSRACQIIEQLSNEYSIDLGNNEPALFMSNLQTMGAKKYIELLHKKLSSFVFSSAEYEKYQKFFDNIQNVTYKQVFEEELLHHFNLKQKQQMWSKLQNTIKQAETTAFNNLTKDNKSSSKRVAWLSNELLPKNKSQERVVWAMPYVLNDNNLILKITEAYEWADCIKKQKDFIKEIVVFTI